MDPLTPEQIQISSRLTEIFMPQFKRQWDGLQQRQSKPGDEPRGLRFVHYTSAEAALNIINSKRLWMRNTVCMSDYSEVLHGREIFDKFFQDKDKAAKFIMTLNTYVPGVGGDALTLFNRWW
jgi:hypothetical protein